MAKRKASKPAAIDPLSVMRQWQDPVVWQAAYSIVGEVRARTAPATPSEEAILKAWDHGLAALQNHLRDNAPDLLPLMPMVKFSGAILGTPEENAKRMIEIEAGLLKQMKRKPPREPKAKAKSRTANRDDLWLHEYESGDWPNISEFAITKNVRRDTMSKALSRARERVNR